MTEDGDFEILLTIKKGVLNIRHPDGPQNLVNAVYYLALAHQIILQKSVLPSGAPSTIVPAHTLPRTH